MLFFVCLYIYLVFCGEVSPKVMTPRHFKLIIPPRLLSLCHTHTDTHTFILHTHTRHATRTHTHAHSHTFIYMHTRHATRTHTHASSCVRLRLHSCTHTSVCPAAPPEDTGSIDLRTEQLPADTAPGSQAPRLPGAAAPSQEFSPIGTGRLPL